MMDSRLRLYSCGPEIQDNGALSFAEVEPRRVSRPDQPPRGSRNTALFDIH